MSPLEKTNLGTFSLFDHTPDLVIIAGPDGYFRNFNQAVCDVLGYTREELLSRPIFSFIHPDDLETTSRRRTELLKGSALTDFENRYIRKSGDTIWLHWTSVFIPDQDVVFAIAKDITWRKDAQKEVEEKYKLFRNLANHFKSSMELEKKNLATALHEELAQLASVAKVEIEAVSAHLSSVEQDAQKRLQHASSVLDLLIQSIRRISYTISPTMLDDLGLQETLQWLCDEFTLLSGIPAFLECEVEDQQLPHELQLDLFRVCQDALRQVMYQAEAETLTIQLFIENNQVCLKVIDDGKGAHPDTANQLTGLKSIRERVASVNGVLKIDAKPGRGTTLCICIPLPWTA